VSRIEWKAGHLVTGSEVLRGTVGDIPAFTLRRRKDGRVMLTDRLQQQFEIHDTEAGAKKGAEHAVSAFIRRINAEFKGDV
jgi:hypothetical protein